MEGEESTWCWQCLQQRIKADFSSDKLSFLYGLSDTPLPFGSSAVVQLPHPTGEGSSPPQFILKYIPRRPDGCLTNYIDQCCLDNLEDSLYGVNVGTVQPVRKEVVAEISAPLPSSGTSSEITSAESQNLLDAEAGASLHGFGYQNLTCDFPARQSCFRTITALAPVARIGKSSYATLQQLASDFLTGSLEDHILLSLILLIEGKPLGREGENLLNLIGVPSFNEINLPGCIRHPNIDPLIGMLKTSNSTTLVLPKMQYTVENILHYSPGAFDCDWHLRFLMYQIVSAVSYIHSLGIAHGDIRPANITMTDSCWCWLSTGDKLLMGKASGTKNGSFHSSSLKSCSSNGCCSGGPFADLKLSTPVDWRSSFQSWHNGELSNFEYLLILNRMAGRRWGDHIFYTVMPWVIDFSVKPDQNDDCGWRDLSKSKWRLAKGDEQLDFTYSSSEIPHHVSDECLSELAVCSYKARRLPLSVLRMAVRTVYEPNEYPSTMQRLYQWTPDECIPEFYCDPQIFYSLHSGMSDLAVPLWAGTPEEFIKLHREALESDRVSSQIHLWIDITFGYKMSGTAAIAAKNVMLPPVTPREPRSLGRRQLFNKPHPSRRVPKRKAPGKSNESLSRSVQVSDFADEQAVEAISLRGLEEMAQFCEHAQHLSPSYYFTSDEHFKDSNSSKEVCREILEEGDHNWELYYRRGPDIGLKHLIEIIQVDDDNVGYQEWIHWVQRSSCSELSSEDTASDIFAVGCILAELYIKRPLFDPISLDAYRKSGDLPLLMQRLPPHVHSLVESCIRKDWKRRPSATCLLESPFFTPTVRSCYMFLAPLQLLAKEKTRLHYASSFAKQGALKAMGSSAAEMCASYCLSLVKTSLSDAEAEYADALLKEFMKCLNPEAIRTHLVPAIQKILQATVYSHLKACLLQGSFVLEIWNRIGKQAYLEKIHPLVLSNLYVAPHKSSAVAASVLLVCSCEELGVPITVHQTILPLFHYLGKGLCDDGIDVVVRIGCLFGEKFIVKQILPLLRNVIQSCISISLSSKADTTQTWSRLALMNCLTILEGLTASLTTERVVEELIENDLYVQILLQANLGMDTCQLAAQKLISACRQIGPELTEMHVLPKLKILFGELAFSQENTSVSSRLAGSIKGPRIRTVEDDLLGRRMELVFVLYPAFASLLGIEKLRTCYTSWLLLEQFLLHQYNWKWECTGESSQGRLEVINARRSSFSKLSTSDYTPAKMLLNGVGWSMPQSQRNSQAENLAHPKNLSKHHQTLDNRSSTSSNIRKYEPWYWFPSIASNLEGLDFLGRLGGSKYEFPWKIRASVVHSVRAHHGALRSFAVCQDECLVFTAGVGPGFKGSVQKWQLPNMDCISGYHGHEEVVNDICVLTSSGRMASCDGSVHVWNGQTGKLISLFSELSENSLRHARFSSSSNINRDDTSTIPFNSLSSGLLNTAFDRCYYTSMHYMQFADMLVVGTGNGSVRFLDINHGKKLHLWRSKSIEPSFPCLVSSLCSSGSAGVQGKAAEALPSWIAAGLSSGHCMLFDSRSGNIIASWQAHDGYVTKLAAVDSHLLVSSSLDKTVRTWDLRRNWTPEPVIYRGHSDGVSGFSIWGKDVISISGNRIGFSSLASSAGDEGEHRVTPQYLYMADRESRSMSALSSISILPFSRLFLVGTDDGHLRICS